MPTAEKERKVEQLAEIFGHSSILITADYSGLDVGQLNEMRSALREQGVKFRVVKNSLAYIAADAVGKAALKDVIQGPTGIAFYQGEPTIPAKTLADFIRRTRYPLKIIGAELDGHILDPQQVNQLATLPSRDELIGQLLSRMQSPIAGLVTVLSGPLGGLARVLQQHADNLSQQQAE